MAGARASYAHHLEVSRLELRAQAGDQIRGRVFLDPRLQLSSGLSSPRGSASGAEAQLSALVAQNLHWAAAGQGCELKVKVLEVWRDNSPSPGHLVDVACQLRRPEGLPLTVSLGKPLGKLLISFPEQSDGRNPLEREVLVQPGGETEVRLGRTEPSQGRRAGALEWVRLGFEHVLPAGLDHVLFVMSLVLGTYRHLRALLLSVLAFTLGHGLALYLAALGLLDPAPELIEPLIALSIVLLAGLVFWQLVRSGALGRGKAAPGTSGLDPSPAHRWPLAAWFGVVHGLGFAGAFSALKVSTASLALTLASFHLGVELGHLVVLGLTLGLLRQVMPRLARALRMPEVYLVLGLALALSTTGLALLAERLATLL